MPVYPLKCNECGHEEDYIFSMLEPVEVETECEKCRAKISRKNNRVWCSEDAPLVKGQTVVRHQPRSKPKGKAKGK